MTFLSPWMQYSSKLKERIINPRNFGQFPEGYGSLHGMKVFEAKKEFDDSIIEISIVLDKSDGGIVDAKCRVYGESVLVGMSDIACELILQQNYVQARSVTFEMIEAKLKDQKDQSILPPCSHRLGSYIIDCLKQVLSMPQDSEIEAVAIEQPIPDSIYEDSSHPNWDQYNHSKKMLLVKQVITADIQPYIEQDAGGIEVVSLSDSDEVIIAYQGACVSCPSAIGGTLDAIGQTLRSKLSKTIRVSPDMSSLELN